LQTETTGGNKERGKLVFRKQLILLLTVTSFYQNYSGQESESVFELGVLYRLERIVVGVFILVLIFCFGDIIL